MQVFDVRGAAWRLDARTLTWRGWALGLAGDPRYQLDRLTGLASAGTRGAAGAGVPTSSAIREASRSGQPARASDWQRIVEARQV
jgi:hypothetical protein